MRVNVEEIGGGEKGLKGGGRVEPGEWREGERERVTCSEDSDYPQKGM